MLSKALTLAAIGLAAFAASYAVVTPTRHRPELVAATAAEQQTASPADVPPGMVWIPGGPFTMGTDDANSLANERPAHRVKLDGFWIDEHDVTNAEFRKFVKATGYVTT